MSRFVIFYFLLSSSIVLAISIPSRSKLQMMCGSQVSDASGAIQLDLKIPGTPLVESRIVEGGSGWFDNPLPGDMFDSVDVVDIDQIIVAAYVSAGLTQAQAEAQAAIDYPDYPKVGSFSENPSVVIAPAKRGWYMPTTNPLLVESIGGSEEIKSGLYFRFIATKASSVVDTFRVNIYWGKP